MELIEPTLILPSSRNFGMTNGNQGNFFSGKAGNFVSGKETAECPAWGKTHFRMIGMKRLIPLIGTLCLLSPMAAGQEPLSVRDSLAAGETHAIERVVVTGTRNRTDIRHLPMTVSVVGRQTVERANEPSLLPVLTEQVPGLFAAGRGVMGYGVSGGAAGQLSVRGIGGPAQEGVPTTGMLVLIDGHPQYMGLFGHPVSDACQSFLAERVEVLRGPASVLYGSNAMGGVVNIVTRKMEEDGVRTHVGAGYGSYNTLQTEVTNRVRRGRFTSIVSGSYNRTDGHRPDMGFDAAYRTT